MQLIMNKPMNYSLILAKVCLFVLQRHLQQHFYVLCFTEPLFRNAQSSKKKKKCRKYAKIKNQIKKFRAVIQLKHHHVTCQLPLFNPGMWCEIYGNMKSEWTVTWTANTLCDEAPHEVGAVLTPVWPSKGVYLGSQQTCSYTHSTTRQILPVITTLALN